MYLKMKKVRLLYLKVDIGSGALFEANTKFIEPALSGQKIQPEEKASLIREIANGNTEQLLKEAEKFRKLGNNKLSPVLTTINGEEINLSVTEGKSQADIVADNLINYIKYVDGILNQEDLSECNKEYK